MQFVSMWRRQFNWRMVLMRIVVNALALLVTVALVPNLYFVDRSVLSWFFLAIALGVLNAVVKPIIQFATLRFIFATYGLVLVLINTVLLLLMAWLFPERFMVTSFLWALVGGAVIGVTSAMLESLLGITPPIVSEKYPELREKIKARESGTVEAMITHTAVGERVQAEQAGTPEASTAADAAAVLDLVGGSDAAPAAPDIAADRATAPAGQEA
jgi:putative membrane protein